MEEGSLAELKREEVGWMGGQRWADWGHAASVGRGAAALSDGICAGRSPVSDGAALRQRTP